MRSEGPAVIESTASPSYLLEMSGLSDVRAIFGWSYVSS